MILWIIGLVIGAIIIGCGLNLLFLQAEPGGIFILLLGACIFGPVSFYPARHQTAELSPPYEVIKSPDCLLVRQVKESNPLKITDVSTYNASERLAVKTIVGFNLWGQKDVAESSLVIK